MNRVHAKKILSQLNEYYDKISEEFSASRKDFWPELKPLLVYIKEGDRVLDLGCGNGRLFKELREKKINYIGLDSSKRLIDIANKTYGEHFILGDGLKLPFKDGQFDKIISIAMFHHLPGEEFRRKFIKEVKRVLKKDGLLILTVWNLWQLRYLPLIFKYTIQKIFGFSKFDWGDIEVPWQIKNSKVIQRYYHTFTKDILAKAFKKEFSVKKLGYTFRNNKKTNIFIIASKPR